MTYVILDLEWNGAFSRRAHGYFNEIIEIGAVKLDKHMRPIDRFGAVIRPVVSRKLNEWVADLTNITGQELQGGTTFDKAIEGLSAFIGPQPAAILTWSNTDLLVLLENFRFFKGIERVPFMAAYADVQQYFQQRLELGKGQQVALTKACEMVCVQDDDVAAHRAPDDCVMTARVLQKIYEKSSFKRLPLKADDAFYARLNFKPVTLCDLKDERVKEKDLTFKCPQCRRALRRCGEWKLRGYAFFAEMRCKKCGKAFTARVQIKTAFEGVSVKRKLTEKETSGASAPQKDTRGG